ncbi:MAG: adenylyltransferase/cytidyltransferase family protein [Eggerthia catenaformis]|uniref:adenylyltransferase/cytidyltransferase family protein n=1 Tax=Eggerthia catenaformis TaxID=31973 RepID=UPI003FA132D2
MVKVITYGTYDLLHYGHIKLLERAKALGDYLIVGVTADDFDKSRGKINVQQTLMERIEAVRATGLADEIIVEEYEGQKIDDIRKYDIDIFTVGSDWEGQFDYLNEYCKVVYLKRTEGVSSSEIREKVREIRFGVVGESAFLNKIQREVKYVNGITLKGVCTADASLLSDDLKELEVVTDNLDELLDQTDAIYIHSDPGRHYQEAYQALHKGKHVLCESPMTLKAEEYKELKDYASKHHLVYMEALKTAYITAYERILLLVKGGIIGNPVAVDAVCTSMEGLQKDWNSICDWGPTALLPVFQILGTDYKYKKIISLLDPNKNMYDQFTKISLIYDHAVASIKVAKEAKSEGSLIVTGTKGYIYVPAPWWKTDYFEIRFEDSNTNKRYFYQLDGEGIRYELVAFTRMISDHAEYLVINENISQAITGIIEDFYRKKDFIEIKS